MPKRKDVTEEDVPFQIGKEGGGAKKAAKTIRKAKEKRESRLSDIMGQIRSRQSTDSHQ